MTGRLQGGLRFQTSDSGLRTSDFDLCFVRLKLQPFWLRLWEDEGTERRARGDYAQAEPAFGRGKPTEVGAPPAAAAGRRNSSGPQGRPERRLQSA
jgi:hypothetical protein